jgi:hypothetical protein
MGGDGSTDAAYNPDIFSVRRTKVAPIVCLVGFVSMIYAVVYKPKDNSIAAGNGQQDQKKEEKA